MKRHCIAKHKNFDFKVTTIVRGFLKNEDSKPSSNQDLESEILANDKLLDEKIRVGWEDFKGANKYKDEGRITI